MIETKPFSVELVKSGRDVVNSENLSVNLVSSVALSNDSVVYVGAVLTNDGERVKKVSVYDSLGFETCGSDRLFCRCEVVTKWYSLYAHDNNVFSSPFFDTEADADAFIAPLLMMGAKHLGSRSVQFEV